MFDLVIHCGDMTAVAQKGVYNTMKSLRKLAGDRPVLLVRGNHDYWQKRKNDKYNKHYGWLELINQHRKWAKEFDIALLDDGQTFETEKVFIGGFSTWYYDTNPATNDKKWMDILTENGQFVTDWLHSQEAMTINDLIPKLEAAKSKTRVIVSHMPFVIDKPQDQRYTTNASYSKIFGGLADHYLFGHSHRAHHGEERFGMRNWQTGSDYDKPKFQIIGI